MINKLAKKDKRNRLRVNHLPLPYPQDIAALKRNAPAVVAKLLDPEVFEFKLENAGVWVDAFELTHYPKLTVEELKDAADCPVPHEKVVLAIEVPRAGDDEVDNYLWYIERAPHGYTAIPFVYRCEALFYCGATLYLDRRHREADGTPVLHYTTPVSHGAVYDNDEFVDHHHVVLGFLRTLCLPAVVIENAEPNERLNRARTRRGQPVRPPRRVVRLAKEIHQRAQAADFNDHARMCASKAPHHRRSHRRILAPGRAVMVRSCIVNAANGEPPAPQDFRIKNPGR